MTKVSMNIRFSVVIPVFNGEKTIVSTLKSVAKQTIENFEVIVVNDGSTDDTLSKVTQFVKEHPGLPVKVITNKNKGRSVSRNIGIINAEGEFVCFLDADDQFKSDHLAEFEQAIRQYPDVSFFFADAEVIRQDNSWAKFSGFLERLMKRGNAWRLEDDYVVFNDKFSEILVPGSLIPMCSTAIRKEILVLSGLFNPSFSVAEDFELWFRLVLTYKVIAINKQLSCVYHHAENTSNPKNTYKNTLKNLIVNQYIVETTPTLNEQLRQQLHQKIGGLVSDLLFHAGELSPSEVLKVISEQPVIKYKYFVFALKQLTKSILKASLHRLKSLFKTV
jgi:glycosyltransferase involved in cell wall biosynthesis